MRRNLSPGENAVIAATYLAGIPGRLTRVRRRQPAGEEMPLPLSAATLKAGGNHRLPWRGRIWGAFIPPWPNYASRRERGRLLKTRARRAGDLSDG